MRPEARGLSLIELLVAVAVIAVLLAVGAPSFQKLQQRTRATTTFHLLTTSMAIARMTAVKHHAPVTVCPSRDGRYCRDDTVWDDGWIVYSDSGRTKQPENVSSVLHRFDRVGPGIALRSTTGRTFVRFQPSGMAQGSNVSLRLCSRNAGIHLGSVIVNNAGRSRTERNANTPCPYIL
ncbi:MAG: GspH/FimT family pseudopilin [Stenotrophomonas sp.]